MDTLDTRSTQLAQPAPDATKAAPARRPRAANQEQANWDRITERRLAGQERDVLEALVLQLREANQNLVLASVNAQNLRDEAEAANQRQNEFLAMLAHELRNPLAPISMASDLLGRDANATPQVRHLQTIIGRQVGHLARLLDDLLDAARISSGKITLQLQPLPLAPLLERTIETLQVCLDQRRQSISLDLPAEAIMLDGDQVRLTQAFSNLLLNASKFTPDHGHLALAVRRRGEQVEIDFADDGVGIPAAVLPTIFALFTQGPRTLARSEGGLGVGLNVVRNIIGLHGGTIKASSAGAGRGSVFSIVLPCAGTAPTGLAAAPAAPGPARCPPCRVLLVEDNDDARDAMKIFLEQEGHTVDTAADGATGLALALPGRHDVLICDIGMPGMNGLELIRAMRGRALGAAPLALALSGYGQAQDRIDALAAGFDAYLVKPVDADALLARMAAHLARGAAPA